MGEVLVGIGQVPFLSYWLTLSTTAGEQLWEGLVDAKRDGDGLAVSPDSIPSEVVRRLRMLASYEARWEPAWEEVPRKLLASPKKEEV